MIWINAININAEVSEEQFQELLSSVYEEKRERILRYRFREDALRSLYGEAMLRMMLKEYFDLCSYEVILNTHGKPMINGSQEVFFNISHSGSWVLCAVSDRAVGIDIEKINIRQTEAAMKEISDYFLADEEVREIEKMKPSSRLERYFYYWTMKEALVKCIGKGLQLLSDMNISLYNKKAFDYNNQVFYLREINMADGYQAAVCSEGAPCVYQIDEISVQELFL